MAATRPSPAAAVTQPVGAVVVSYRPQLPDLARTLAALAPQVQRLWVVDNGSGPDVVHALREMLAGLGGDLIAFTDNRGIAAAHNAGIEAARSTGLRSIVLFDQDSVPAPAMVQELAKA